MYTVIFLNKRSSELLRDHKFLFKPFVDEGIIGFCNWNETGTDVRSSVPELYNLIKGKKEWRALILNTDSMYSYRDCAVPDKKNPFDYSDFDKEVLPHESPVPLIRLTHIIGGYTAAPTKEFEKGFEYYDAGEKKRVRAEDLSEEELKGLEEKYEDVTSVYLEKPLPEELLRGYAELKEKYDFSDARPSDIHLVATRRTVDYDERAMIEESWKNHLEMRSSSFWEKNKYPSKCRFLFCDITNPDNSLYRKELTEFWLSVLTLATNKIAASTLQAYRLYRLGIRVDREKMLELLDLHLNKLTSVSAFIKEQLKLKPDYSFEEDKDILDYQEIPITIEQSESKELLMDFGRIGLSRDCPADEFGVWQDMLRERKINLEKYLKTPRRAVDKAAKRMKARASSFRGERYSLDQFQLEDLRENIDELERKIITSEAKNIIDKKKIGEEIEKISKTVRREIAYRMHKLTAVVAGLAALLVALIGFIPYMVSGGKEGTKVLLAAIGLTLGVLLVSSVGGLISLFIQRGRLVRKMKRFNTLMREVSNNVNSYIDGFSGYFSDICTYMSALSILEGVSMSQDDYSATAGMLNVHRHALNTSIKRATDWFIDYDLEHTAQVIDNVTYFFDPAKRPRDCGIYYFEANADEDDIPINDTGDRVTSPYSFVEKLCIERENIFDSEEAQG